MMGQIHLPKRNSQRGAALITALVFLGVITLLSVTSMRESTIGVRMAQNEEARLSGIQAAQALTEAVVATPAATPVIGGAGFSICTAGEPGCNAYGIPLPAQVANEVAMGHLSARVQRMTPPEKPPPRVLESSIDKFSAASFQVAATFDRTNEGLGSVQLVEGMIVLVPNF
ncbi:MAG: PilX N-terminal domain-containing pilus assembly protein [Gammaproteobacteria bacterium]|nr:PilX N-terminal domain-containing pilus assembly protein [Gammaproteobacteria bacterium]